MGKFSSQLPRYRSQNRDLGNRASPASHMNTSILLQRKEWRGEIAETEPGSYEEALIEFRHRMVPLKPRAPFVREEFGA